MYNTPTVPCEKSKIVYFASSIMKNIVAFAFVVLLLDQHQVLLFTYNVLWNKHSKQPVV